MQERRNVEYLKRIASTSAVHLFEVVDKNVLEGPVERVTYSVGHRH